MSGHLLKGKNIIVTGSARGIGQCMVDLFAKNGANVWAIARMRDEKHERFCQEISQKYSVRVEPVFVELTDMDAVREFVKGIRTSKCQIDGLVNNAGITFNGLFQMTTMQELRNQFEVNFFAPYYLTQLITKIMGRSGGGSIVNISSSAALDGNAGKSAYGSAKAAVIAMSKCISEELAAHGIRVNAICPGITSTDMLKSMPEYIVNMQKDDTFLKQIGTPADIANTAMFLLSDLATYITGQVIRVDGGVTSYQKRQE